MGVLADHLLVVSCSATTTSYASCVARQRRLSCLFACRGFSTRYSVCALSLSLSLSLMAGTYWFQLILTSFGWHVIPAGHFSQKSLCKNPRIGFFPLLTIRPCPLLPLIHDPPLLILVGYRLVVSRSCMCFTLDRKSVV